MTREVTARITTLEHDGLTFEVFDEGPLDGEPIVLLHGFPERNTTWRLVTPALNEAGFRTLALDQRGYAEGARPKHRRDYRLRKLAGDVTALIDAVGGSAHVVGHDWGAIVAWTVATVDPGKVRTLTTLSLPHPEAYVRSVPVSKQAKSSAYILALSIPGLAERLAGTDGFANQLKRFGMTSAERERFQVEMVQSGAIKGGLMWYRAIPLVDFSLFGKKITVPTTFVWSDQDLAVAKSSVDRTAKYCTGPYEQIKLSGITHWIPTQAPESAVDAILGRVRSVVSSR